MTDLEARAPDHSGTGVSDQQVQPRRRHRLLSLAVGTVLALGLLMGLLLATSGPASATLPPFSLARLGRGARVVYPGSGPPRPTVISLFASWCPGCQEDLPVIAKAAQAELARDPAVRFLGIDGGEAERSAGLAFARKSGVKFPVGYDYWQRVAQSVGIDSMPTTIFVAPSGAVVHVVHGPITAPVAKYWISKVGSS